MNGLRLLLLLVLGTWFYLSCGTEAPTFNECSTKRVLNTHPVWLAFASYVNTQSKGANACLQMVWSDSVFRGGSSSLVRLSIDGSLSSPDDPQANPFQSLSLPSNPDQYKYRFRVFVFPSSIATHNVCDTIMKSHDYSCELDSQHCWFMYEVRVGSTFFVGKTYH